MNREHTSRRTPLLYCSTRDASEPDQQGQAADSPQHLGASRISCRLRSVDVARQEPVCYRWRGMEADGAQEVRGGFRHPRILNHVTIREA